MVEPRDVPRHIADAARYDFPVTRDYLMTYIVGPMERNSHSFRRGLAVAIRLQLHELGFNSKPKLSMVLPAINKICGWSRESKEFFNYTEDFQHWSNKLFNDVGLYVYFIREYFIENYCVYGGIPKWLK